MDEEEPAQDDPPYNPEDDDPANDPPYNPEDDDPVDDDPPYNPEDDDPPYNPEDDDPPYNPEDDDPADYPDQTKENWAFIKAQKADSTVRKTDRDIMRFRQFLAAGNHPEAFETLYQLQVYLCQPFPFHFQS